MASICLVSRRIRAVQNRNIFNGAGYFCCRWNHEDPTLVWARKNPLQAEQSLQFPVWDEESCDSTFYSLRSKSLEGYCKWRKWPFVAPSAGRNDTFLREKTLAISSHVLSTPLTLATFVAREEVLKNFNNICCVGARAEATIPFDVWKEYLLLCSSMIADDISDSIDFVGPDIVTPLEKTGDRVVALDAGPSLLLRWHYKGYFHDLLTKNESAAYSWDTFAFFNPGFGHPHLKDDWQRTLERILPIGRPVLLTAHSELDASRDAELLQQTYGIVVDYRRNPFCSRIRYQDPFQKDHSVSPNRYVGHIVREK